MASPVIENSAPAVVWTSAGHRVIPLELRGRAYFERVCLECYHPIWRQGPGHYKHARPTAEYVALLDYLAKVA